MRKVLIFFIVVILLNFVNVYASNLMIEVKVVDNVKTLEYYENNKLISFEDANKKYNVPNYVSINYNNEILYFYQGKEIDEATYNNGINEDNVNNLIKKYGTYAYRVRNTDELINTVKKLFDDRNRGVYHLVYSATDLSNIDFKLIEEYMKNNYVFDSSINTFNYLNHGIISYPKYMFDYDESEMVINVNPIISKQEESYVNDFLEVFKYEFEKKSDYEKILFVYTYLKNTVSGCDGTTKKGASAYDALINRNASCIGESNAFQLIMENIGIESYIVDDIKVDNSSVISSHTFNVVNLEGVYYIIDLQKNNYEGFLIGNTNNYQLSNGKIISESSYNYSSISINIDYNKYDKLVNDVLAESKKTNSLKQKEDNLKSIDFISYIVLMIILLFLTMIIVYFTRKDR